MNEIDIELKKRFSELKRTKKEEIDSLEDLLFQEAVAGVCFAKECDIPAVEVIAEQAQTIRERLADAYMAYAALPNVRTLGMMNAMRLAVKYNPNVELKEDYGFQVPDVPSKKSKKIGKLVIPPLKKQKMLFEHLRNTLDNIKDEGKEKPSQLPVYMKLLSRNIQTYAAGLTMGFATGLAIDYGGSVGKTDYASLLLTAVYDMARVHHQSVFGLETIMKEDLKDNPGMYLGLMTGLSMASYLRTR